MTPTPTRYLEDLAVGERHTAGPIELTEAESVAFATRYDPQPMHIDAAFAAQGPFHGLIASGWQTCSLIMRMTIEAKVFGSTLVLGLGVDELRWPIPVRPSDSISTEIEILSITPSKSKPQFGVVRMRSMGRNQRGEVVLSMVTSVWVPRRPV
jgi:acyl dehydratase